MIARDTHIDQLVIFFNQFAEYINNNSSLKELSEHILISIEKNIRNIPLSKDFIFHVIGKIFYYKGLNSPAEQESLFKSLNFFEHSIK
jgi:hypothetical protein